MRIQRDRHSKANRRISEIFAPIGSKENYIYTSRDRQGRERKTHIRNVYFPQAALCTISRYLDRKCT
jgi:hypothetical protein